MTFAIMKPLKQSIQILFILGILPLLSACGHHQNKEQVQNVKPNSSSAYYKALVPKPASPKKDTATHSYSSNDDDSVEELHIIPYKIKECFYSPVEIKVSKPFTPEQAMKKLFPGHYYRLPVPYSHEDIVKLIAWSCPSCPRYKFKDYFYQDVIFPLRDSNETRVSKMLQYTDDDGRKNIIISFSTTEFTSDLLPCGRFSGAFLSLALFTESDSTWNLKVFTPVLGYYGGFQSLPNIQLLKFGKNNFGCYIDDANGPAGGPFYSNIDMFGVVDSQFRVILVERLAAKTNSSANWDYKIKTSPNDTLSYNQMLITTTGHYSSEGLDTTSGWDNPDNLPSPIQSIIMTRDNFDFTIVSNYLFKDGKYVFTDSKLQKIKTAK